MTTRHVVQALLCVVALMIPFEELLSIQEGMTTGIFLVTALAFAGSLFVLLSGHRPKRLPSVVVLLAMFMLWCCMSVLWTQDPEATLSTLTTYSSVLLFLWMLWEFTDSRRQLLWLMRGYIAGCCISLSMLFTSYISGRDILPHGVTRYTVGGMNENRLALVFDVGIVFASYFATDIAARRRILYWGFIPIACLGVLLTGSRTGTIAMVFALFMGMALSSKGGVKSIVSGLSIIALSWWLVSSFVPAGLLKRVTEGTSASTFIEREQQWSDGLDSWIEVPIKGVGAGAFVAAVVGKGGFPMVAHNTYVQILVEDGVIGLALMAWVWVLLARAAWKLPRRERLLSYSFGGVWAIAALTASLDYHKITWLLYGCVLVQSAIYEGTRLSAFPEPGSFERRQSRLRRGARNLTGSTIARRS